MRFALLSSILIGTLWLSVTSKDGGGLESAEVLFSVLFDANGHVVRVQSYTTIEE